MPTRRAEPLLCTVEVHNTGDRSVSETVQLYVRRVLGGTSWPRVRELRGFARIELVPGERTEVSFPVGVRTLASVTRGWERAVEPGEFAIATGPSSDGPVAPGSSSPPRRTASVGSGRGSEPSRSIPPPFPGRGAELRPVAVSD
ncbi:fibronectin type III-like domain-contianing protein [Streptomyces sp. NPDC005078]